MVSALSVLRDRVGGIFLAVKAIDTVNHCVVSMFAMFAL